MEQRQQGRLDGGARRTIGDGTQRFGEWPLIDRRSADPRPHYPNGRRRTDRLPPLPVISDRALACRRALDLAIAGALLAMLAPLMLAIALVVKVTSRGPALFRQERVGRGGKHFIIIKYRTMIAGTDELIRSDAERWLEYVANDYKLTGDARLTPIGKVLRKTSLDELPQLINVIRGEMSIVGIRPLIPDELGARPRQSQRLYGVLTPGMTGLWQVEGRSHVRTPGRIDLDDDYVTQWSLRRDIRILIRTPAAVARPHQAL